MKNYKSLAAATLALLLLAACGSVGDVLGGGTGTNNNRTYDIRGTVDHVDTSSRSVYLTNVSGYTTMLSNGGSGNSVRVYYNDQTPVDYNGQNYRPQDLERGDQVTVRVDESGNTLVANSMTVTYDVSSGSTNYPNGSYPSGSYPTGTYNVRGSVLYVDSARGTMTLNTGSNATSLIEVSSNTPVYYNGQTYHPADLERGDEVDIRVNDLGGGRVVAQDITVTRSMSGTSGSTGSTSNYGTIRGTVRYVDTARQTIELSNTNWTNFSGGTYGGSGNVIISYNQNTSVDVQGRSYPVNGLEPGDVIDVQVQNSGGSNYFAQRIILVRDIHQR